MIQNNIIFDRAKVEKISKISEMRGYKVVKRNDFIQRSLFCLTVQEMKIILFLISQIKPEDTDLKDIEFKVSDFCDICGIDKENGKNYLNIKNAIKKLADKSAWITNDDGVSVLVRWISKAWVVSKSGIIIIKLDDDLKPYLLQLRKNFTAYELVYTLVMNRQYSIRLYEILKSYEFKNGHKYSVEEIKALLNAKTYARFPDFKRRVIDPAIFEINDVTDIMVTYDMEKDGAKVQNISFHVRRKQGHVENFALWNKITKTLNKRNKRTPSERKKHDENYFQESL